MSFIQQIPISVDWPKVLWILDKTAGGIGSGKRSDLVLLDANPLADVAVLIAVDGLIAIGTVLHAEDASAGTSSTAPGGHINRKALTALAEEPSIAFPAITCIVKPCIGRSASSRKTAQRRVSPSTVALYRFLKSCSSRRSRSLTVTYMYISLGLYSVKPSSTA